MGELRLGCSGWDYDEWIGPFYQRRSGSKLQAYTRVFDTAEINSTFYRAPTPGMVQGWTRYTPEDFRLAAKVPQTVTHDRLLEVDKGADGELRAFCDLMAPLHQAGKLGVLLLQLPPRLEFHPERTRTFFEALPEGWPFAIEFRNESWMVPEAFALLEAHHVAYTVVDEPLLPPEVHLTSSLAYFRWHGHGSDPWYNYRYDPEELAPWIPRIQEAVESSEVLYGYFNNHFHGYAPENCLEVLEMLDALTPEQRETLERMRDYRRGVIRSTHGRVQRTTLEDFTSGTPPAETASLADLTTETRMDRARRLAADGVEWTRRGEAIRSVIRGYEIALDPAGKRIRHGCADWEKNAPDGPLCKHVVALMLALPVEVSRPIVRGMSKHRDRWTLEAD